MKLSISNLAWKQENDKKVIKLCQKYNFSGIEILPTKIWGTWENINKKKLIKYKKYLKSYGLEVSSIQSLFYKTDFMLERNSDQKKIIKHFKKIIKFARFLGCKNLVFGSPSFRRINSTNYKNLQKNLLNIFKNIKKDLVKNDVTVSIEPNPKKYGCNFINKLKEANTIVKKIKSNKIKIQLDAAGTQLEKDNINNISKYFNEINHVHLSEKNLIKLKKNNFHIRKIIKILKKRKWKKWVSIEMMNLKIKDIESTMKFISKAILG